MMYSTCAGLDALVRELRTRRDRWVSQLEAPLPSLVAGDWETIYVEVKDQVTYFKGWHVQTSLTGPLNKLCGLAPFRDELSPCLFSSASNMHVTIPPASPRSPPPPTQPQSVPAGSPATTPASEFYVQVRFSEQIFVVYLLPNYRHCLICESVHASFLYS